MVNNPKLGKNIVKVSLEAMDLDEEGDLEELDLEQEDPKEYIHEEIIPLILKVTGCTSLIEFSMEFEENEEEEEEGKEREKMTWLAEEIRFV
ncbi:hypothetical protein Ancab_038779 [Ancistrocladus abbreviatus]